MDKTATEVASRSNHVVLIGATSTSIRLVDELMLAKQQVVVLAVGGAEPWLVHDLSERQVEVVSVPTAREAVLRGLDLDRARCVVVLGGDDVETMRIALLVEEVAPAVRMVLEMENRAIRGTLSKLLGQCVVLSSAELAAPSFVSAALEESDAVRFTVAGRQVVAGSRRAVGGSILAVLGDSRGRGIGSLLGSGGDIVLGTTMLPVSTTVAKPNGMVWALLRVFDRRLRWVIAGLVLLMFASTLYFHVVADLDWSLSFYAALTASTLTGIGDIGDLSLSARFGAVVIQLAGLLLSSGITAVIVDALWSSRLASLAGGVRGKPTHHVLICGLGRIGRAVALALKERGYAVVAIERHEDSPGVLAARSAKVPVVVAEGTDRRALQLAGLDRAAVVLAVTDDDAVNLEIAMVAKHHRPQVRVVTRLFDHELAERIERRLDLGPTRSVSMLSSSAFAAAVLEQPLEQVVSVGRRVVLLTEQRVTGAASVTVAEVEQPHRLRVLAHQRPGSDWSWTITPNTVLRPEDRVAVAASKGGLAALRARWS